VLVEMDSTFNLSLKAKQEERKNKNSDTENSMANAETEDEDLANIKGNVLNRRSIQHPGKRIIGSIQ